MKHIEEHILELYLLGDKSVQSQKREIEAHLKVCAGCQGLVERMTSFYAEAEATLEANPTTTPSKALARPRKELELFYGEDMGLSPPIPLGVAQSFTFFVREHRGLVGAGFLTIVATLVLLLNSKPLFKDINPVQARFNNETRMLEVYNKSGEQLWKLNWYGPDKVSLQDPLTVVADLDGDGKNEIVTMQSSVGVQEETRDILKAFDSKGNLIFRRKLGRSFRALGKEFDINFSSNTVFVDRFVEGNQKEIIVSLNHVHSPDLIIRLDPTGKELGAYWHYGHLAHIISADLDSDGRKELILGGVRDIDWRTDRENREDNMEEWRASFAVLDPMKITGEAECSATPVFGLPLSRAELYYVTLPRTNIDTYFRQKPRIIGIEVPDDKFVTFWRSGGLNDATNDYFEYFFSRDLRVIDVKTSDVTRRLQLQLFEEGKIKHRLDAAYFDYLKRGVRYWDGKEWRKEVVRVESVGMATGR